MKKKISLILISLILILSGCSSPLKTKEEKMNSNSYMVLKSTEEEQQEYEVIKTEMLDTIEPVVYEMLEMYTENGGISAFESYMVFVVRDKDGQIQRLTFKKNVKDLEFENSETGKDYIVVKELNDTKEYKGVKFKAGIYDIKVFLD